MLELAFIREHADEVRQAIRDLNTTAPIDEILSLDEQRRSMLGEIEALRARRNAVSKEVPKIADKGEKQRAIEEMRQVGDRIKLLEADLEPVQERLDRALLEVPNMPDPSVPVGPDESQNVILRQDTTLPTFDFEPLPHWDLGEALGITRFRARGQDFGHPLLPAQGGGRSPAARADRLYARCAHPVSRLHRDLSALCGAARVSLWHRPTAQVRREPVLRYRG